MSYETIPTTPENEFEALAPVYLEIFQSLTGNDAQKFAFYSMDPFEKYSDNYAFRRMLREEDEDAARWAVEEKVRRNDKYLEEETKRETNMLAARSEVTFSDLITQGDDGRHAFIDGELGKDWLSRALATDKSDRWIPQLRDITADDSTIIDFLVYRPGGATNRLVGVDPETGHLVFGDEMHGFRYDYHNQQIIGTLGAAAFRLDEMGRFADLTEEQKHVVRYPHLYDRSTLPRDKTRVDNLHKYPYIV